MTYSDITRILTLKNIFSSYVAGNTIIKFTIKGWTNPTDTTEQQFTMTSYWDDTNRYLIDSYGGDALKLTAKVGICTINDMYPTDENTMYRDTPRNYTVKMNCIHAISFGMGI